MTAVPTPTPFQPDDLFRLHLPDSAALSPDGRRVVYAVTSYDQGDDADYCHLWLQEISTGESRQLTFGKHKDTEPQWSPDGRTVAFLSTRSGKAQIYLLPMGSGEAWPLTALPQGVTGGPVWSPDGARIAFSARPAPDQLVPDGRPYRIQRAVYRFDALGYLDRVAQAIFVVDVTGGAPRQLTADGANNMAPRWSPDGTSLLYLAAQRPDSMRSLSPHLCVVDLHGNRRVLVGDDFNLSAACWLPDGRRIAIVGTPSERPIGSKSDLWVFDLAANGRLENRSMGLVVGVGGKFQGDLPTQIVRITPKLFVGADGKDAFVQVQAGGSVNLYAIALEGEESCRPLVTGEQACYLLDMSLDGTQLLYAATDFQAPLDLYMVSTGHGQEQQLTQLNAALLAERALPAVEHLLFAGRDGVQVEGWLLIPPTGAAPYPTVLYIHGGPHQAFGASFHGDMQMLAGAGYAVLLVNHRASTGYGDEFSTAIKGAWGDLDSTDLMAGVDAAIARGLADPDRLGVCGLSGGGNLTCWIVGQTDRFRAAVPENPVTNWLSFYGVSDIGVWFSVEQLGGHPHEIPEVYARCSPITYAHRCRTPTLLIQGEHDWRCPAEQSEQFYTVLKANGCVVEMIRLPGSSHAGAIAGTPATRRAQNEALLEWMNRWVLA